MPCPTQCGASVRGQYSMNRLRCPFHWRHWEPTMELTSRLFLCGRCRKPVIICSRCDRGQIYCADGCSPIARRHSVLEAGHRYQQSRQGRFNHAERMRRYRLRRQKVTHQGSELAAPNDLLSTNSPISRSSPILDAEPVAQTAISCSFCGQSCSVFVRQGFLRHRRVPSIIKVDRKGAQHDHFP